MRYCLASAVRNLTFFTLLVLSTHSFVFVHADDGSSISLPSSPVQGSSSSSAAAASSPSPSSPPPSSPSPSPKSQSSQSSVVNQKASTTSQPATPTSDTSDVSSGPASSASLSDSSSSAATSATSQLSNTFTVTGISAPAYPTAHYSSYTYSGLLVPTPSVSTEDPGQTAVAAASNKSFSDNKGAIAAIAVVASLVGLGIVICVVMKLLRRRARLRDEEDEVYFEKYRDPEPPFTSAPTAPSGPSDTSYNISSATRPATHDAYPDRSMHYGAPAGGQAYGNPHPQQYGMEYPPNTAYAAAAQGGQYQYQESAGYSQPGSHPFADPQNTSRQTAAPPVARPAYGNTVEPYYGSHESAYAQ